MENSQYEYMKIIITVHYVDQDGDRQMVSKEGIGFESAEENLGKLERFVERNAKKAE